MEDLGRELNELVRRYPVLSVCRTDIERSFELIAASFAAGGKLLVCGNGGSAADAEHIVGELMKSFLLARPPTPEQAAALRAVDSIDGPLLSDKLQRALPAVSLCGHPALSSAFANDAQPELVFAQQVFGLGRAGDLLLAISTSGNSRNVVLAALAGRALGLKVVGLTGGSGGRLAKICDVAVKVPAERTYEIQELQLPVYHVLCIMLERCFFGADSQ